MPDPVDRIVPKRLTAANRRQSVNQKITAGNVEAQVSVGFYRNGVPCEVFISTKHPGSELALSLQDTAVLISVALQHGIPPRALAKSVARIPEQGSIDKLSKDPATIVGAVLDLVVDLLPKPPEDPRLPL